ncbi:HAD family phosphatase [Bifidobacterium pullorum subsp. saeculare]|uniref:HAD family phosphatase n=1 Tax=Bifidobacterium pullorum subsp. saeculare TaxID=78257 RepID=A0A939B9B5_9BIFI|nr:HAD family phosphatase [Bifidobacterium pullorum]MBM6699348.1 HAD family phosphatase [Bifidobacterium pullorum subsp. saeculare]
MPDAPRITDVILDFCGVVLDWQVRACLEGRFPDQMVDRICADDDPCGFFRYEDRMDAGEELRDILPDVRREQGDQIASVFVYYIAHYGDALPRMMPGMEALMRDVKEAGYGLWGLTNWSHETIHIAFDKFPALGELLDGTVVSGVEKLHKPDAAIYELALGRFGLDAASCVFLDDTARNVAGAEAVGIHGIRFTDARDARRGLRALGVAV